MDTVFVNTIVSPTQCMMMCEYRLHVYIVLVHTSSFPSFSQSIHAQIYWFV